MDIFKGCQDQSKILNTKILVVVAIYFHEDQLSARGTHVNESVLAVCCLCLKICDSRPTTIPRHGSAPSAITTFDRWLALIGPIWLSLSPNSRSSPSISRFIIIKLFYLILFYLFLYLLEPPILSDNWTVRTHSPATYSDFHLNWLKYPLFDEIPCFFFLFFLCVIPKNYNKTLNQISMKW